MEQFLTEIEAYATDRGILPSTVIQSAVNASGATWARWKSGGGCSVRTMERVRAYMAAGRPFHTLTPQPEIPHDSPAP